MKVVINRCFGGFSLSPLAIKELVLSKSSLVEKSLLSEHSTPSGIIVNLGDGFFSAEYRPYSIHDDEYVYYVDTYENSVRSHPDLIEVVERLGDAANGTYAKLQIVEIPDGVGWYIDEYDGMERVHEAHRSWY